MYVLTPMFSHCERTVAALEAGKHVMCESPWPLPRPMQKRCWTPRNKKRKAADYRLSEPFPSGQPGTQKTMRRRRAGRNLLRPAQAIRRRGVPTWGVFPNKALQGGGPLIDIGTHSLDLTLWMMNNYEPRSVMGASFESSAASLKPGEQGNGFSPGTTRIIRWRTPPLALSP